MAAPVDVPELFVVSPSPPPVTDAVLEMLPNGGAPVTFVVIVIGGYDAPAASTSGAVRVHVIVTGVAAGVAGAHVQPVPVAAVTVSNAPGGTPAKRR